MNAALPQIHRRHAVSMLIGGLKLADAMSAAHGERAIGGVVRQAQAWARDVRGLLAEIASDAAVGRMEVAELLSDGEASAADIRQLDARFARIEKDAREGRIVPQPRG